MAKTVKEFLLEKGVRRELAVEMDEMTLAMHSRIARFSKQGVTKNLVMIDLGKYRHLEQKGIHSMPELQRMVLDYGLFILNFIDRFTILQHYNIVKLNVQTGEYEFTEFGESLFPPRQV